MQYPWQAHYFPGIPTTSTIPEPQTVVALLEHSFVTYRDSDAYVFMGHTLRYGDVDALSQALAAWLQAQPLQQGDCVAIMLPNLLGCPVAMAAVLRAGLVAVYINPLHTPRGLQHQLQDSGAKAIVILDRFVPALDAIVAHTDVATVLVAAGTDLLGLPAGAALSALPAQTESGSSFVDAIQQGRSLPYHPPALQPSDPAVLQYSGGTTGVGKKATLLHSTLVAHVLACEAWMQSGLNRPRGKPRSTPFTIVCALPLYHVFAFVACSLLGMRAGARNILIPNPHDTMAMIALLKPYKLHMFPAVNALFNALLQHPDFAQLDFSELCISHSGASVVQAAVASRWLEATGCPVTEGFGPLASAAAAVCNYTNLEVFTGDIGFPMSGAPLEQPGEIAIQGPRGMVNYWKRPRKPPLH